MRFHQGKLLVSIHWCILWIISSIRFYLNLRCFMVHTCQTLHLFSKCCVAPFLRHRLVRTPRRCRVKNFAPARRSPQLEQSCPMSSDTLKGWSGRWCHGVHRNPGLYPMVSDQAQLEGPVAQERWLATACRAGQQHWSIDGQKPLQTQLEGHLKMDWTLGENSLCFCPSGRVKSQHLLSQLASLLQYSWWKWEIARMYSMYGHFRREKSLGLHGLSIQLLFRCFPAISIWGKSPAWNNMVHIYTPGFPRSLLFYLNYLLMHSYIW